MSQTQIAITWLVLGWGQLPAAEPLAVELGPLGASCVAFAPNGRWLAVATCERLLILDASTGAKRASVSQRVTVWSLAFSVDSARLACGIQAATKQVQVYESETLKRISEVDTGSDAATAVAYSPDGPLLAVGSDKRVILLDARTFQPVATLTGHIGNVGSLAFSPDGARLASGCWGGRLIIWDVPRRKEQQRMTLNGDRIAAIAFSVDGGRLAAATRGGVLSAWSAVDGRKMAEVALPSASLCAASFPLGDKTLLAAGMFGQTGNVVAWSPATRQVQRLLPGSPEGVTAAALSPDGKHAALAGVGTPLRMVPLVNP